MVGEFLQKKAKNLFFAVQIEKTVITTCILQKEWKTKLFYFQDKEKN